jgi:anthranilate phosphoribosyltransferase
VERILLHPRDHGITAPETAWTNLEEWRQNAEAALRGEGALAEALRWNLGAYLWFAGRHASLAEGLERAGALLLARSGERLRRELAG